jgi:hypothetical protein
MRTKWWPRMECSRKCVKSAVAGSRQRQVLQLWVSAGQWRPIAVKKKRPLTKRIGLGWIIRKTCMTDFRGRSLGAQPFPYKLTERTNWPPRQTVVTFNDSHNTEIPCAFSCITKSRISGLTVELSYYHIKSESTDLIALELFHNCVTNQCSPYALCWFSWNCNNPETGRKVKAAVTFITENYPW